MNEHPTNHVERDPDSGGGRISQDRRLLTNVGLAGKASFEDLLGVAKIIDRASPDSRRAALYASCDKLEGLIPTLRDTAELLRDIAVRGVFPLEPSKVGGPVSRAYAYVRLWWAAR